MCLDLMMRCDGREGAGLTTDLLLGGCVICWIWMFDGDGTAHDRDDHYGDGGGGGCGLDLCLWGFGSGEQYVRVCGVCAGVTGVVACL